MNAEWAVAFPVEPGKTIHCWICNTLGQYWAPVHQAFRDWPPTGAPQSSALKVGDSGIASYSLLGFNQTTLPAGRYAIQVFGRFPDHVPFEVMWDNGHLMTESFPDEAWTPAKWEQPAPEVKPKPAPVPKPAPAPVAQAPEPVRWEPGDIIRRPGRAIEFD